MLSHLLGVKSVNSTKALKALSEASERESGNERGSLETKQVVVEGFFRGVG